MGEVAYPRRRIRVIVLAKCLCVNRLKPFYASVINKVEICELPVLVIRDFGVIHEE
jgi:hypothetical protein